MDMNFSYMSLPIEEKLAEVAAKTEAALDEYLSVDYVGDSGLVEAMRYATLGGGKRIRAFLVLEFCKLFGGSEAAAIPFACALEMVHAYSLIHDDLPCMDNDDLRRGKPTCHIKYGEANALLAGDSLLTYAFEVASSNKFVSDRAIRLAVTELARQAGTLGMAGGQYIDLGLSVANYDELKQLHMMKTSALIKASCLLGYYAACDKPTEENIKRLSLYAEAVGLAFQIHDDLLDVKSDTATLGKAVGSDEKNGKKTVLQFKSMFEAEDEESLLTLLAVESVSDYIGSEVLCKLALWLLERKK